ncbi:unnamed protein product, partial [Mesorhabditis belari]|uniref:Exocyst complex component Sec6 n=1 Tax=Mesorhabditis belari TaxID=2138241 RepID=A0AAF3JAR9_9BILA
MFTNDYCFRLLLSLAAFVFLSAFTVTYEQLPQEYQLLIPPNVYKTIESPDDRQGIEEIFHEFDSPIPIENITQKLREGSPIFAEKIAGFLEKITFQFDILRLLHPNGTLDFEWIEKRLSGFLVNEAIDFFAFTPLIDVHTFQEASSTYGPLSHVKMDEMNEQIEKLLPHVAHAIANLSTEFEAILDTISDSMLTLQLQVVDELGKEQNNSETFDAIRNGLKKSVYELVPESLEKIKRVLPYAMINGMHELQLKQMEKIWEIYEKIPQNYSFYKGLSLPDFHSFDIDFLRYTVRQYLSKSLDSLIAHKKFTLVRDLTNYENLTTETVDRALISVNFIERIDGVHEELSFILNNRLTYLFLCAIGSVPPPEYHYVRRLVALYLPGERLLTKVAELLTNAPYLAGKVLFAADRVNAFVRLYCKNHQSTCHDLNNTAEFVTNYYVRGMLRIFDLLPETEIDHIKQVQIDIKLQKYKFVMESLNSRLPSLFNAIIQVHENIERKLGAMSYLGTQEFIRKLEADTLRVMILLALREDEDQEDYHEYARSWRRGFTSMGRKARAELAVALPEFAKVLTTSSRR